MKARLATSHGQTVGITALGDLYARLTSRYGHERASAIIKGQDAATNADVAAWRNLGRSAR